MCHVSLGVHRETKQSPGDLGMKATLPVVGGGRHTLDTRGTGSQCLSWGEESPSCGLARPHGPPQGLPRPHKVCLGPTRPCLCVSGCGTRYIPLYCVTFQPPRPSSVAWG